MSDDGRRHAPATKRNREPILAVLRDVLPARGLVVEVASGTGEHAAFFATRFPQLEWQPTDAEAEMLDSIRSWVAFTNASNLRPPLRLDVLRAPLTEADPALAGAEAVLNVNMIHIAPWAACEGLMRFTRSILSPGGVLVLYGPFKRDGRHTATSNAAFDESLRARNPEWGVRDLEDVVLAAAQSGLVHVDTVSMPANNLSLVFRLEAPASVS